MLAPVPPAQIPACALTHGAPASDDDERPLVRPRVLKPVAETRETPTQSRHRKCVLHCLVGSAEWSFPPTVGICGMSCNNAPQDGKFCLNLPPSGCRNSFSSGSDGKATRDDLHRKDWDGSSCGLVRLRLLSKCPSVPQGGHYWAAKWGHF